MIELNIDSERVAFELIANAPRKRHAIYVDQYECTRTQDLWSVWLASASHRAPTIAPDTGELAKLREDDGPLAMACIINKKLGEYIAGRTYLLPDDLAALKRFHECATDFDSGGHDVPREAMRRLTEIGVCRHLGFGNHTTTSFGDFVLERAEGEPVKLPLKTLQERNADAALAPIAQQKEQGNG